MPSQHDKAMRFRALHETPGIFVIPNVWDGGSASVMAGLGFEALATSKKVMPPGFFGTGVTMLAYGEALVGLGELQEAEPQLRGAHDILLPLMGPHDPGVQRSVVALVHVYERTGQVNQEARWRQQIDPAQ